MKNIKLLMFLMPTLLLSESSERVLYLERSARVIASYFGSYNPNENLFEGVKNVKPIYPKELFDKKIYIEIKEEHSLSEVNETTIYVQGIEEFTELFNKRKIEVTTLTLGACADNCCSYPTIQGINHNHIYLHEACFVFKKKRAYLKSILLYNGD